MYKDLNLAEEQKKLLEENRKSHKEEARALFKDMRQKRDALRQELEKGALNMDNINQINNELKKLQAEMLDHRLAGVLEVRKILTPEQFKKFMARTEKRLTKYSFMLVIYPDKGIIVAIWRLNGHFH